MQTEPTPRQQLKIDLSGIAGRIQRGILRASDAMAIGLSVPESALPPADEQLPGAELEIHFRASQPLSADKRLERWCAWVLTNCFRDVAELIHGMVDEIYLVLRIWALTPLLQPDGGLALEHWHKVLDGQRRFHRSPLPSKILALSKELSFEVEQTLAARLSSINAVRNCFAHRSGVVGAEDLDDTGVLRLQWKAMQLYVAYEDGTEEELQLGTVTKGPANVVVRPGVPMERTFALGESLTLNVRQFAQICWSVYADAVALAQQVQSTGEKSGAITRIPVEEKK